MSEDIERAGLRAKRLSEILKAGRTVPLEQVIGLLDDVADMLEADKADGEPPSTPPGWVLVPVEPTPGMLTAAQMRSELGTYACSHWSGGYSAIEELFSAMLSAAPKP